MRHSVPFISATFALALCASAACAEETGGCSKTVAMLAAGKETVRIACMGDSITGRFYHTGGKRAWCDMLGIALQKLYPQAKIEIINAGQDGGSTPAALERLQKDVLDYKPHLVAIMFGMNDCTGLPTQAFYANMTQLVQRCRDASAEVVLMTPNSTYPDDPRRPPARLEEMAATTRQVAADMKVPLADCYKAYEDVRARDPRAWMMLLSETIHPCMNGHKVFAEQVAKAITGQEVSLADVPPMFPSVPRTLDLLAKGEPVKVIAMTPYDTMIEPALRAINPNARAVITPWAPDPNSLTAIEESAKPIREQQPDLVIVAIPATATAPDEEAFFRFYNWVINWAMSYGGYQWDVLPILPSVLNPNLTPDEQARESLAKGILKGYDVGIVAREPGDQGPAAEILARWFARQAQPAAIQ